VFENTRNKEKWADPKRSQLRKLFIERDRRADKKRDRRMIDISRSDKRDRACVIDAIRIGVDPRVELRGSAQRKRPEKSRRGDNRDRSTPARAALHWLDSLIA